MSCVFLASAMPTEGCDSCAAKRKAFLLQGTSTWVYYDVRYVSNTASESRQHGTSILEIEGDW